MIADPSGHDGAIAVFTMAGMRKWAKPGAVSTREDESPP
jgi:hypothetical protein